jgi:hypothetical protein
MVGERESLLFIVRPAAIYIDFGATSNIFSVHDETCGVNTRALHVPYDLYGITQLTFNTVRHNYVLLAGVRQYKTWVPFDIP